MMRMTQEMARRTARAIVRVPVEPIDKLNSTLVRHEQIHSARRAARIFDKAWDIAVRPYIGMEIKGPPWIDVPDMDSSQLWVSDGDDSIYLNRPDDCMLPVPHNRIVLPAPEFAALREVVKAGRTESSLPTRPGVDLAYRTIRDALYQFSSVNTVYHNWPWFRHNHMQALPAGWEYHLGRATKTSPDSALLDAAEQSYASLCEAAARYMQSYEAQAANAGSVEDNGALPEFLLP